MCPSDSYCIDQKSSMQSSNAKVVVMIDRLYS